MLELLNAGTDLHHLPKLLVIVHRHSCCAVPKQKRWLSNSDHCRQERILAHRTRASHFLILLAYLGDQLDDGLLFVPHDACKAAGHHLCRYPNAGVGWRHR